MTISFEQFWSSIDEYTGNKFKKLVKQFAVQITAKMIEELLKEEEIKIGFGWHGKKTFAVLSIDPEDKNKELTLRYHHDGSYELYFSYYNDSGNLKDVCEQIARDQIQIPVGLETIMNECVAKELPITIRKKDLK